jgi:antitoxin HicB
LVENAPDAEVNEGSFRALFAQHRTRSDRFGADIMIAYRIETAPDDNGTVLVTCPAFPEVTTFGPDDREKLASIALKAIEEAIAARISDGDPLPREATTAERKRDAGLYAKLPLLTALKVQLYNALREAGISRAELARRLGWHREQVDRLFRLDHASRVDQIEAAFKELHRDIDIRVLHEMA